MLIKNPRASRSAYPEDLREIMNVKSAQESGVWLSHWDQISRSGTPLWALPDAAEAFGIAQLYLKDESVRSPLGSFKALGAPVALMRLVARLWNSEASFDPRVLISGGYAGLLEDLTVISATDGNHGKSLAAAAQAIGCRCVIVLHANVSVEREESIAAYGAEIIRISGNYDESVQHAARLAQTNGWHVVSDTSYDGYETIPRDVMQGYGVIPDEVVVQLESLPSNIPFTHVFLQGGVGGLAAGIATYLWEHYGARRPTFIVVEPQQADCLYQSAIAGSATRASGSVDSVMAGLACGETSPLAWKFLEPCIDYFMTITDDDAVKAMQSLAHGTERDAPLVVGESGAAGFAGLTMLAQNPEQAHAVGLTPESRVLVISTEGATAPNTYADLVGESAHSVLARQQEWMQSCTVR
ncbi:diaminopropionate ammonia-lyase [Burkholderia cenocepacia]|jgi:diaminopropionate ammonia-lyase|uniref:diaminopropionate ammonia-lyase n=1 Tax=Burkholderia cenocepacia TaxID=95486 RepID=UPI0004F845A2|nr:diaminopropionate ammonia-lyase [Burkholderia cenocepacia]AIO43950.1 diaminopropionate ammonia-lyase family protein [Burkholderia cepacia]KGC05395.1 diaminopropionate ammonia-lyase family protein [Burkholderia cepacia]MCG0576791.1 diaminopropionate ammonia-lyase [Burkholderia cenocepacia]MCW3527503.1 diaminopropionate ammonia-lyase [Burkholderia cenocepacia]MCW3617525.1 diaminopropionate ammonia-lyase [Burkholderia cenocepacia]